MLLEAVWPACTSIPLRSASCSITVSAPIRRCPGAEVQQALGHSISATLTPAPEMFAAATRMHTPAILDPSRTTSPRSKYSSSQISFWNTKKRNELPSPVSVRDAVQFAGELLTKAEHAVILTGAGLSTPSGIPDFRSEGTGLWSHDEPLEVALVYPPFAPIPKGSMRGFAHWRARSSMQSRTRLILRLPSWSRHGLSPFDHHAEHRHASSKSRLEERDRNAWDPGDVYPAPSVSGKWRPFLI